MPPFHFLVKLPSGLSMTCHIFFVISLTKSDSIGSCKFVNQFNQLKSFCIKFNLIILHIYCIKILQLAVPLIIQDCLDGILS